MLSAAWLSSMVLFLTTSVLELLKMPAPEPGPLPVTRTPSRVTWLKRPTCTPRKPLRIVSAENVIVTCGLENSGKRNTACCGPPVPSTMVAPTPAPVMSTERFTSTEPSK